MPGIWPPKWTRRKLAREEADEVDETSRRGLTVNLVRVVLIQRPHELVKLLVGHVNPEVAHALPEFMLRHRAVRILVERAKERPADKNAQVRRSATERFVESLTKPWPAKNSIKKNRLAFCAHNAQKTR